MIVTGSFPSSKTRSALASVNIGLFLLVATLYCCRAVLIRLGLRNLPLALTAASLVANIAFFQSTRNVLRRSRWVSVLGFFGVLLAIASLRRYGALSAVSGWTSFFFNLTAWTLVYLLHDDGVAAAQERYLRGLVVLGIVTAIFGLYQYYVDFGLLGFNVNEVYSNLEAVAEGRITKRAFGLMVSPQTYAPFLAIALLLASARLGKARWYWLSLPFLFWGGLVSGSRAFSLMLIVYVFAMGISSPSRLLSRGMIMGVIAIAVVAMAFSPRLTASGTFGRMLAFNLFEWEGFSVISRFFMDSFGSAEWLRGEGLGNNSRLYARLSGIPDSSPESYFLILLLQGGLPLLLAFSVFIGVSIRRYFRSGLRHEACLCLALMTNLMATPAFSGLPLSFIAFPLFLFPYFAPNISGKASASGSRG